MVPAREEGAGVEASWMGKMSGLDWSAQHVLVTGGASFIGSHLVEALLRRGARVRVVDDLSSGRRENLGAALESGRLELVVADLLEADAARRAVEGVDRVFHLAADHGGRGYIDTHQAACSTNLALDSLLFLAAHEEGVEHVAYASSGCVYPTSLQGDPDEVLYLEEDMVRPPYEADDLYGWAKLMGELALRAYHREHGLRSAVLRYFTVYGERCSVNHAVMAMIARALVRQDPFVVWGTGEQIRNWTHVSDVVEGTILASERIADATPVNLGTTERTRVLDAARSILERCGVEVEIRTEPDRPTGPYNRVSDIRRARELLGWEPRVAFSDGIDRTLEWVVAQHSPEELSLELERGLVAR